MKTILYILCVIFALSLCGCGTQQQPETTGPQWESPLDITAETTEPEITTVDPDAPDAEVPLPTGTLPDDMFDETHPSAPDTEPATEPDTEPVTDPATDPATEPVADPTIEPTTLAPDEEAITLPEIDLT